MTDDWDDILLHRDSGGIGGIKNIGIPSDIKEEYTEEITDKIIEKIAEEPPKEIPKELPKEISLKSVPKVADVLPFLPDLQKAKTPKSSAPLPKKTISPYISPTPYGPRSPAIWSADWANKFATLSVALVISFGIYTYAGYVADYGLKQTALAVADSIEGKGGKLRDTLSLMTGNENKVNKSQLAVPAGAILKF